MLSFGSLLFCWDVTYFFLITKQVFLDIQQGSQTQSDLRAAWYSKKGHAGRMFAGRVFAGRVFETADLQHVMREELIFLQFCLYSSTLLFGFFSKMRLFIERNLREKTQFEPLSSLQFLIKLKQILQKSDSFLICYKKFPILR